MKKIIKNKNKLKINGLLIVLVEEPQYKLFQFFVWFFIRKNGVNHVLMTSQFL